MADNKEKLYEYKDITNLQRLWLARSIQHQKDALIRSAKTEMEGSEIKRLREHEIAELEQLRLKFV